MEFNNIHLSPIVLAGLYKHSLVLVEGEIVGNGQWLAPANETNIIEVQEPKTVVETTIKPEIKPIVVIQKDAETVNTVVKNIPAEPQNITIQGKNNDSDALKPTVDKAVNIQPTPAEQIKVKYLGGFEKKISIVLAEHFQLHISDENLTFLSKLLQACQLSLKDVAIINVASNQTTAPRLWQLMPAEKMIIFDVDPGTVGLPFRLSHFKLQPWDSCVFLSAPSLEALQEGTQEQVVQLKRNLWESLKKMFLS